METFYAMNLQYLTRILVSAFFGACIGFEREKRFKTAGIRTHILVALSSCLMMIVSKYGFWDVLGTKGVSLDVSRIAAGVVTAIGFLGAGVIFVRKESITGVTTAAGLWATVGVGIATGAGMFLLSGCTTLLILLIQFLLHRPLKIFASQLFGTIQMVFPPICSPRDAGQDLCGKEDPDQEHADGPGWRQYRAPARRRLPQEFGEESIMKEFKEYPYISSIEYYPSTDCPSSFPLLCFVVRTGSMDLNEEINALRDAFRSGKTYERAWRVQQLTTLKKALAASEGALSEALRLDLGKDVYESYITEIGMVYGEIDYALKHLGGWMHPAVWPAPWQTIRLPTTSFPNRSALC
jgi:hypothetical protein